MATGAGCFVQACRPDDGFGQSGWLGLVSCACAADQWFLVSRTPGGQLLRHFSAQYAGIDVRLCVPACGNGLGYRRGQVLAMRSEEHTSELQSLMRISYDVFCL